jgi:deoxyribodipyrimidine photolyase-related protein
MLSSSLNIGLINPRDILDQLKLVKNDIPLNSLEGYFRQLCWREFQRYCYIHYSYLSTRNYFSLKNPINKKWYEGTTNILPVDNCIKKAFDTGYLHHIERLMIIGNFMILSEIKPTHGHRWFMEFAIDSYEWVMLQNVYDMVFFNGNGLTSYKPYITSNNYLIKMSNYSKTKEWNDVWNSKYRSFLKKHTSKLYKYRYHFKLSAK